MREKFFLEPEAAVKKTNQELAQKFVKDFNDRDNQGERIRSGHSADEETDRSLSEFHNTAFHTGAVGFIKAAIDSSLDSSHENPHKNTGRSKNRQLHK